MPTTLETPQPIDLAPTSEPDERGQIGRVAALRARALRRHAATVTSPSLHPLRAALLTRAGELELAANVLSRSEPQPADLTASA